MKIALVQMDLAWERPEENHRRAEQKIQEAAALGCRLVVLPEMFTCGFSFNAAKLAEEEGGPTELFLKDVCEGLGIWILAGVPQRNDGRAVNNALLCSPNGEIQRFTKLHPFRFSGEHEHYAAGTDTVTWEVEGLRITPFICYDLRFPEEFRERAAQTDVFVVIASWPERRRAHWQALLKARAIENLCYVCGVNRVGEGGGLSYAGDSVIHDPWGEPLATASGQEALLVAELSAARVAEVRKTFPALDDRRS